MRLAGRVELNIYDVAGRKIARLLDKGVGPGFRTVTWDLKDGENRLVSNGVYFARAVTETQTRVQKIVVLR